MDGMPTSDLPLDTQFATLLGSRFKASLCNKEQNMDQFIRDEAISLTYSNIEIIQRFQNEYLRIIVNASWSPMTLRLDNLNVRYRRD